MPPLSLDEFVDKITEIMPVLSREFYKQRPNEFDKMRITLPQLVVLKELAGGQLRMTDLAHSLNVTTAAMTGIIDRLVRDGYVRRETDDADRRIIKVRATAKGGRIVKEITERKKSMLGKIFGIISQNEREEYLRILTLVRDRLIEQKRITSD